jgi:2-aminoadipate transaminase
MKNLLSNRIKNVPESFIRKILKVSTQPDVISFAGGLPSADLFPIQGLEDACTKVLQTNGKKALQYSSSEGDAELRAWIAKRYKEKQGLNISPDNILITNGSQQALDLLGKVLLNEGDPIAIENPGYLGAIQSFSLYQPKMHTVAIDENGLDVEKLSTVLDTYNPKLLYTVPNFQNPTGISYSQENREAVAQIVSQSNALLIQDDPYGELRFSGEQKSNFYELLPEQTLLLGSFSKIVVPSFRLGWIVAPDWLMKPLVIAKQAADLHTNYFSQQVISQYLKDNALDDHIKKITQFYGKQKQVMMDAIAEYFPAGVKVNESEGGMFLWVTLPKKISAMDLFDKAIKEKVAFVPGKPFYVGDQIEENTMRLSYVTVDEKAILEGIKRLGLCIKQYE